MKMSPRRVELPTCVMQFGVCVIDRNLSFERFVDLNSGPGKAEALRLRRDLEAASVPPHDVVIADVAFVDEATDFLTQCKCLPVHGVTFSLGH